MRRAVYGLGRAVPVTMIGAALALEQEPEPEQARQSMSAVASRFRLMCPSGRYGRMAR